MMLYNVPEEACIDLLIQDWNNAGVSIIETYNPENPRFGTNKTFLLLPISLNHAIKLCEVQTNDDNLVDYITFKFDFDVEQSHLGASITGTLNKLNGS